jgi:glycosyltransferase involved in cell wall biosynthesis
LTARRVAQQWQPSASGLGMRRELDRRTDVPYASIVIATRNRRHLLAETLQALAAQQWPRDRIEILIADNGSTDETPAVVASAAALAGAPRTRYLYVGEPGKSHAVNRALDLVLESLPPSHRTDDHIIAFTDDDVRPAPDWIARIVEAIADTGADFVAGRVFPLWETEPPAWMSPALYGVLAIPDGGDARVRIESGSSRIVPIGANTAVRASVVAAIGGLRTDLGKLEGTLRTGEDHEFFLRMLAAGYRGIYEPRAVVSHWVPRQRLDRTYCRKWLYQNGRDVARLDASYRPPVARLLGVPRYLWRQGASNLWSTLRASATQDAATRFAAAVRVLWLGGYVRQAWFGR